MSTLFYLCPFWSIYVQFHLQTCHCHNFKLDKFSIFNIDKLRSTDLFMSILKLFDTFLGNFEPFVSVISSLNFYHFIRFWSSKFWTFLDHFRTFMSIAKSAFGLFLSILIHYWGNIFWFSILIFGWISLWKKSSVVILRTSFSSQIDKIEKSWPILHFLMRWFLESEIYMSHERAKKIVISLSK